MSRKDNPVALDSSDSIAASRVPLVLPGEMLLPLAEAAFRLNARPSASSEYLSSAKQKTTLCDWQRVAKRMSLLGEI